MMNLATLHLGQIPAFDSRRKKETILSQTLTPMIFLMLQIMMRRSRGERMRLEQYGR
jgi:hypothetical protein